ncbi:MAG: ribosome-associated translation inhibitor RaiA [Dehalococcoidales bacterium]|nr:ribosome-associated translation inhibitor RaiA [Dehalococcoidales bacterium]
MELQIAGTNLEIPREAQRYIERKATKLNKHLPDIIDIKVEVSGEKTKSPQEHFLVRVIVNSGASDIAFHAEERGQEINMAVDKVVDVMTRQLEKHKGKLYDKGRGNPLARGKYNSPENRTPPVPRKLVKTKRFVIEALSLDLAIEEMERLGHNFFLYLDEETEEMRVLYRRNDGDYGLIEPEIG